MKAVDAQHRPQRVVRVQMVQIVADGAAPLHRALHLGQRKPQLRTDVITRQVHERHATVEDQLAGQQILFEIESSVDMRRMRGEACRPHHHDALGNRWRHQQRARDIGQAADGQHIQRLVLGRGERQRDQVLGGRAAQRRVQITQIAC